MIGTPCSWPEEETNTMSGYHEKASNRPEAAFWGDMHKEDFIQYDISPRTSYRLTLESL